jgi:hypothetical protein
MLNAKIPNKVVKVSVKKGFAAADDANIAVIKGKKVHTITDNDRVCGTSSTANNIRSISCFGPVYKSPKDRENSKWQWQRSEFQPTMKYVRTDYQIPFGVRLTNDEVVKHIKNQTIVSNVAAITFLGSAWNIANLDIPDDHLQIDGRVLPRGGEIAIYPRYVFRGSLPKDIEMEYFKLYGKAGYLKEKYHNHNAVDVKIVSTKQFVRDLQTIKFKVPEF